MYSQCEHDFTERSGTCNKCKGKGTIETVLLSIVSSVNTTSSGSSFSFYGFIVNDECRYLLEKLIAVNNDNELLVFLKEKGENISFIQGHSNVTGSSKDGRGYIAPVQGGYMAFRDKFYSNFSTLPLSPEQNVYTDGTRYNKFDARNLNDVFELTNSANPDSVIINLWDKKRILGRVYELPEDRKEGFDIVDISWDFWYPHFEKLLRLGFPVLTTSEIDGQKVTKIWEIEKNRSQPSYFGPYWCDVTINESGNTYCEVGAPVLSVYEVSDMTLIKVLSSERILHKGEYDISKDEEVYQQAKIYAAQEWLRRCHLDNFYSEFSLEKETTTRLADKVILEAIQCNKS